MTAIAGTRRTYQELADGTIRVKIDIDPAFRDAFLDQFRQIDMPVALAPLKADFESMAPESKPDQEKPKGGDLARLAGQLCNNPRFQEFLNVNNAEEAARFIRTECGIVSRAELDHDLDAQDIFHARFRRPFAAMQP